MTEHRILRNRITNRVRLTDGERRGWPRLASSLAKQALAGVATMVKPDAMWQFDYPIHSCNAFRNSGATCHATSWKAWRCEATGSAS